MRRDFDFLLDEMMEDGMDDAIEEIKNPIAREYALDQRYRKAMRIKEREDEDHDLYIERMRLQILADIKNSGKRGRLEMKKHRMAKESDRFSRREYHVGWMDMPLSKKILKVFKKQDISAELVVEKPLAFLEEMDEEDLLETPAQSVAKYFKDEIPMAKCPVKYQTGSKEEKPRINLETVEIQLKIISDLLKNKHPGVLRKIKTEEYSAKCYTKPGSTRHSAPGMSKSSPFSSL